MEFNPPVKKFAFVRVVYSLNILIVNPTFSTAEILQTILVKRKNLHLLQQHGNKNWSFFFLKQVSYI